MTTKTTDNLIRSFNDIHTITRKLLELSTSATMRARVDDLQALAGVAERLTQQVRRDCDELQKRVDELEREVKRLPPFP